MTFILLVSLARAFTIRKHIVESLIRLQILETPQHIKYTLYAYMYPCFYYMSQRTTKPTKLHVRPAKTQISLGIRPIWSESLLYAQWIAKDPSFLHADSEDSGQTGRMPRLIWVFAGRTCHFVGFVLHWLIYLWNSMGIYITWTC